MFVFQIFWYRKISILIILNITHLSNWLFRVGTNYMKSIPLKTYPWIFFLMMNNYAFVNYEKYYRRLYSQQFHMPYADLRLTALIRMTINGIPSTILNICFKYFLYKSVWFRLLIEFETLTSWHKIINEFLIKPLD